MKKFDSQCLWVWGSRHLNSLLVGTLIDTVAWEQFGNSYKFYFTPPPFNFAKLHADIYINISAKRCMYKNALCSRVCKNNNNQQKKKQPKCPPIKHMWLMQGNSKCLFQRIKEICICWSGKISKNHVKKSKCTKTLQFALIGLKWVGSRFLYAWKMLQRRYKELFIGVTSGRGNGIRDFNCSFYVLFNGLNYL